MDGHDWPARGVLLADRYRLIELCGVGGMSAVWRADDVLLDRSVAVKALAGPYANDVRLRTRIMREARTAGRLSHPNITAVYDYGEAVRTDGTIIPFVVMELLEGLTLQQRLESGPLPWQEAAEICARVAEALAQLHEHGVVHRDVTPGNIICGPTGIKILDFGISALVGEADDDATGITFGTVEYVAPERLDGAPASGATDVFALGVLLYELVSGRAPFPAESWDELAVAYEERRPVPPPPLPPPLDALCERCLAMEADDRPSAAAAAAVLDAAVAEPTAPPPRVAPRATVADDREQPAHWHARHVRRLEPTLRRALLPATAIIAIVLAIPATAVLPFIGTRSGGEQPVIRLNPTLAPPPTRTTPTSDPAPTPNQPAPSPAPPAPAPAPPSFEPSPIESATATPAPAVSPVRTPSERAVQEVRALVDEGAARNQIRPDVVDDLSNLIGDLSRAVIGGSASEIAAQVDTLRRKVDDRSREGTVALELADRLATALEAVISTA